MTGCPGYPDYQRACGWNALLPAREGIETLKADRVFDVAIVGAGYTGLAAARRAAEHRPDQSIAVLDASEVGEGNPGRNSGFLLDIALSHDADPRHIERMTNCNSLIAGAMDDIRRLVEKYDIACDLVRAGTYRAAAGATGVRALRKYRAFLDAAGLPFEVRNRRQLRDRLGTDFYREGLYSPHCYLVQPAALIRGLAANLPASVTLFENSPAVAIEPRGDRWTVRTPDAGISASRLIIANNAFCKQLGIGQSRIAAMYTYAALTEPLPQDLLDTLGAEPCWGLLPAHRLGSTLRRTRDGRLLIRSLYGYEKEADNGVIAARLMSSLQERYPQLMDVVFASVWSGATGFTFNGAPLWGRRAPGLFVSAGCNGGGVVKGTLFGQLLANLAFERDIPDFRALFGAASWMPPEPLRHIGFGMLSGLERYKGRAEV